MSRFADIRTEWRVSDLERKLEIHEHHSTNSRLDSLERTLRETCAALDELRNRWQNYQESQEGMRQQVDSLINRSVWGK